MKTFFFAFGLSVLASPLSFAAADFCPRDCYPPQPTYSTCKVEMVDCRNHHLYLYTGTASTHRSACQAATRKCLLDLNRGYGGYGAKCWMIGKKELMSEAEGSVE